MDISPGVLIASLVYGLFVFWIAYALYKIIGSSTIIIKLLILIAKKQGVTKEEIDKILN